MTPEVRALTLTQLATTASVSACHRSTRKTEPAVSRNLALAFGLVLVSVFSFRTV